MYHFYPTKTETVRALKEIILTIVETNLLDAINIKPQRQYVRKKVSPFFTEEMLTSFQKRMFITNGIYVEIENHQIFIQLTVNVKQVNTFMDDIKKLQKQIYEEVKEITGFNVSAIDIKVKNLIKEETKKTQ